MLSPVRKLRLLLLTTPHKTIVSIMRKPDEIMAEYLLKGGKMLAKACSDCGSPLFEYKGETFCVVCKEEEEEKQLQKKTENPPTIPNELPQSSEKKIRNNPVATLNLNEQFTHSIKVLLMKIEDESDSGTLVKLTQALKDISEAYAIIHQG